MNILQEVKKLSFVGIPEFFQRYFGKTEQTTAPNMEQVSQISGETWGRGIQFDPGYDSTFVAKDDLKTAYWDATTQNALKFLTLAIMKMIGLEGYYHKDKRFVDLYNAAIEEFDGSFENHIEDFTKKLIFFGWMAAEMPYKISKSGLYTWGWMVNHNPWNIIYKCVIDKDTGKEFISSVCISTDYTKENSFPANRFIIGDYGDISNVYGHGIGHYIHRYTQFKLASLKYWAIFLQRFVYPILIGKSGDGKTILEKLKKLTWKNILHIRPEETIEILQTKVGLNPGQSYEETIAFCNKEIWKNFMLLALMEDGSQGGSYALGKTHKDLFIMAAQKIADYVKENVLLTQCVQPLIEWNYGPQDDYGTFESEKALTPEELKELGDVYNLFVNAGILDPISDNEWIRQQAGFPEAKKDEFAENKMREIANEQFANEKKQEEYSQNKENSGQIRERFSKSK
jgi:hypothetical protein